MSKAAKARLPGERRGDGGSRKRGGSREWRREKQTEAGVNYGCNLRFPRGKERQRETSSHAYQITHLPHFLIMVREQTRIQSGPCVRCLRRRRRESTRTFIHAELCGAVLCRRAFPELDMTCVYKAVLTFIALLCRTALRACAYTYTVTWPLSVHT